MDWNPGLWKQTWPHYTLPGNNLGRLAMAESLVEKITPGVVWTVTRHLSPAESWPAGSLAPAKAAQRLLGLWGEARPALLQASDGSLTAYFNGEGQCWIR